MARQERVGNLGYLGLAPQTNPNIPVPATDFVPLYDESMTTNRNLQDQAPIYGNKFETMATLPGMRQHGGDVTVIAEPNTGLKFFDSLLTTGSKTGSGPYTWPQTLSPTGETYYTYDISTGNIVKRFWGVKASKITPAWNNNEMQFKVSVSALGSFIGREIASVSTANVTLKTDYDGSPTTGLVVGDLVRIWKASDGTTQDFTVSTVTSGTVVALSGSPTGISAGDMIYLRPATVAFNNLPSFLWSNTQFCFGSTASAALAATQFRVETGSTWEIDHNFNNNAGEQRSGGQDPASLARTTGNAALTIKKFFDTPEDLEAYNNMAKSACVIRHFAYSGGNAYEFRITYNSLVTDDPNTQLKSKELSMSTIKMHPGYNISDGQGMGITFINNLSAIS